MPKKYRDALRKNGTVGAAGFTAAGIVRCERALRDILKDASTSEKSTLRKPANAFADKLTQGAE